MSENTPGLSNVVQLVPNPKPLQLELCLICQNVLDSERQKPTDSLQNQKSLDKILPGQELILNSSFFRGRDEIPEAFSPDDEIHF